VSCDNVTCRNSKTSHVIEQPTAAEVLGLFACASLWRLCAGRWASTGPTFWGVTSKSAMHSPRNDCSRPLPLQGGSVERNGVSYIQ